MVFFRAQPSTIGPVAGPRVVVSPLLGSSVVPQAPDLAAQLREVSERRHDIEREAAQNGVVLSAYLVSPSIYPGHVASEAERDRQQYIQSLNERHATEVTIENRLVQAQRLYNGNYVV